MSKIFNTNVPNLLIKVVGNFYKKPLKILLLFEKKSKSVYVYPFQTTSTPPLHHNFLGLLLSLSKFYLGVAILLPWFGRIKPKPFEKSDTHGQDDQY